MSTRSRHGLAGTATRLWAGGMAGIAALVLALLSCYGLLALAALLPLLGTRLVLGEATWAGAIAALAVLTIAAVLPGTRRHGSVVPGLGALAGGGLILYALLVHYGVLVELAGFLLLSAAVFADVHLRRRTTGG